MKSCWLASSWLQYPFKFMLDEKNTDNAVCSRNVLNGRKVAGA